MVTVDNLGPVLEPSFPWAAPRNSYHRGRPTPPWWTPLASDPSPAFTSTEGPDPPACVPGALRATILGMREWLIRRPRCLGTALPMGAL